MTTGDVFFPYKIDPRWKAVLFPLGVDDHDGVTITEDGRFVATFGRVQVDTPMSNIDHTAISGPHRWYTAVGMRLSFVDDGLTFGTNHHKGLCVEFIERIPRVIGFRSHSALWVSVEDPEGLAETIGR